MPRMMLSMLTAIVVSCMVCLVPTQTAALPNGPHLESTDDNSDNISLTCPSSITIDCDFDGIYLTYDEFVDAGGSANLEDGCDVVTFAFVGDTEFMQDGCMFAYMREYTISTSCDNVFTCNQIVMLTDDDDPFIVDCPSDVSLPVDNTGGTCLTLYEVPTVTATDGCSPTVTIDNDSPGVFPIGTTTVTYTATDECGNSSTCTFDVTITDESPLAVTCPPTIDENDICSLTDLPAYADIDAFTNAGGSVSGNCSSTSNSYVLSVSEEVIISASCPLSVNRTYMVTDGQGNSGTCTQLIIIRDEASPTFIAPLDMTVDCAAAQDTAVTGAPSAIMDNCDMTPAVTWFDSDSMQLSTGCTGEISFTRSWIVTDQCMNADTLTQNITTEDVTPPTAVCKDTFFVYLNEIGDAPLVADSLDNGSTDDCSDLSFFTSMSFVACNQISGSVPATLDVMDGCGNMSTCALVITLLDTLPVVLTSPPNDTVSCIENVDAPFTTYDDYSAAGGSVIDNCKVGNMLEVISEDTTGMCPITIVRTYLYTDISENSDTATHTIVIIDDEAPEIVSCPMDIIITETDLCDTLVTFGTPVFTDNCQAVTVTNDYTNDSSTSAVFEGGVTVINFFITDACGNADTCTMTVDIAADPRVTFPPVGEVNGPSDVVDYTTVDSFIMAGGMINMFCMVVDSTFDYDPVFDIDPDGCTATLTETVTFTNTEGEMISAEQTTTLMDTLAPVVTGCFNQILTLRHEDCGFDTIFTLPTATDNFGIDTTYFTVSEFIDDVATVSFTARDLCGTETNCEFDLLLFDPTSPDFMVDDITIMCDTVGAAPPYLDIEDFLSGPNANIYDCRLDSTSFLYVGSTMDTDGNEVRTYTISDTYGNDATITQTIFIMDQTVPIFTSCPSDTIVGNTDASICAADIVLPSPIYEDNCNGDLTLTHNSTFGISPSDASGQYPVGTTSVTYTLTDESGLSTTCTFSVTVQDTIPPAIDCPPATTVDCSIDNYSVASTLGEFTSLGGTAVDACGIMSVMGEVALVSANNYVATYTITDQNGNVSTCTHDITVVDTERPSLSCTPFILVTAPETSCDTLLQIPTPTAIDNCSIDTIYNDLTLSDDASMVYSGTTTITWYAFDAFGNSDTCETVIMVMDGSSPVLRAPDTTYVMCIEMVAEVDSFMTLADLDAAGGSSFDNCGIDTFYIVAELIVGDSIVRRQYQAVDTTGNTSTVTQVIVIDDTTAPAFDAPADVTIDCTIATTDLSVTGTVDSTMLSDNCMDIDTLTYIDSQLTTIGCPETSRTERIWILTDESGNESRDTQLIVSIDTTGPVFNEVLTPLPDIPCDGSYPATQTLTATDACGTAIVQVDTLPFFSNYCTGFEVTYRYIARDLCGYETRDSISFHVLPDMTPPQIVDSSHQIIDALPGMCGVPVSSVPRPIYEDDCVNLTLSGDFTGEVYALGLTEVTWIATNDCGLMDTTVQRILIEDNEPPVIVCQDLNVSLGGDGIAIVQADTLALSITDNCDHYFGNSTKVRRLDSPTHCDNDGGFNDHVMLCCDDIGNTILVEVQVTDDSGNVNTCTSEISVNNAQGISLITGLPDISISCEFLFDPTDLSIFGSFVEDPNEVEDIRIEDHFYPSDSIAGQDGVYINTCGMTTVTETSETRSGSCGRDTILRYFLFDNGIQTLTYVQTIYRSDVNLFNADGNDIIWPAYFTWNQCANPAPDTSISGAPTLLNNDYCSQVAVSFKDQLFNFPLTSCPFIKRKWKVIDWCQYDADQDPNPGLWTYEQFINVENDVPPTILTACNDTLVCAPGSSCSATLDFSIAAIDDCMADAQNLYYIYNIDVNNDGSASNDISGTSASFSHPVEAGDHKITWIVEDRCGNTATCSFVATVQDCKDPTPICLTGLAIDLAGNTSVELWASDVDYGSTDNCTPQSQLGISFSADVTDDLRTFTCDDLGNQLVELWATDAAGNQAFCTAVINVQDNSNGCGNITNNLQGRIATETNISILEAMVSIQGAEMDAEIMTDELGQYAFSSINPANDYEVAVDRDKDHLEGVTTLDLVLIQRHILGLKELDSPYKLIAADINSDERLSPSDLLSLRKVILGIEDRFEDNTSWRFVSKNSSMSDMDNPWPFTESLILDSDTQAVDADFIGIKIGDVNNSADALLSGTVTSNRQDHVLHLLTAEQRIKRDDQVLIDISASEDVSLEALQMTIRYDEKEMSLVDIVPIGIQMEDHHYHIADGELTIAWTDVNVQQISASVPIFQLIVEGNTTTTLSSSLRIDRSEVSALAYDASDREMQVDLNFLEAVERDIVLSQNRPNPFLETTTISFELPEDMEVTFKVFNSEGKLIYRHTADYASGPNTLVLGPQLGAYRGMMILKMEAAEYSDVRRMIRIE